MKVQYSTIAYAATTIDKVASISLGGITCLIFFSSLSRYLLSYSVPDAHSISSLILGIAILWGLGSTNWRNDHISVDIIWNICPASVRRVMDISSYSILTVFVIAMSIVLFFRMLTIMDSGETTSDLALPLWPFYTMAWAGSCSAALLAVSRLSLLIFDPKSLPKPEHILDE